MKKVKDDEPMSFVIIYVEDGGFIGTPEAIKNVIKALGNTFKVKSMGDMDKFVGCHLPRLIKTVFGSLNQNY
jgi:hypothetical protein